MFFSNTISVKKMKCRYNVSKLSTKPLKKGRIAMRYFIVFMGLFIITHNNYAMFKRPTRPPCHPHVFHRVVPTAHTCRPVRPYATHDEKVQNMVRAIQASGRTDFARSFFIRNLFQTMKGYYSSNQKKRLVDAHYVVTEAALIHIEKLQNGTKQTDQ